MKTFIICLSLALGLGLAATFFGTHDPISNMYSVTDCALVKNSSPSNGKLNVYLGIQASNENQLLSYTPKCDVKITYDTILITHHTPYGIIHAKYVKQFVYDEFVVYHRYDFVPTEGFHAKTFIVDDWDTKRWV